MSTTTPTSPEGQAILHHSKDGPSPEGQAILHHSKDGPWKKGLILLFLAVGGIGVGLIGAELTLSALRLPRFFRTHTFPPQFSFAIKEGGISYYVNAPSKEIDFVYDGNPRGYFGPHNEVVHVTNSWGFRGGEFSLTKPAGELRIAFLGDSFTFGEGVRFEDTYPEVLKRLMQEQGRPAGGTVECYNFGVGGYNTEQELFLLKNVVLRTHPDIIVLGYALNDAEPALFYLAQATGELRRRPREDVVPEGIPEASPPDTFVYRLRSAQLAWQVIHRQRLASRTREYYQSLYREDNSRWQATRESLRGIVETCRANDLPLVVVCFPVLYRLESGYPFMRIHELLRAAIASVGYSRVRFVDLLPALRGKRDSGLWVHPTDQHPNETVHRIAAASIADAVREPLR